MAQDFAQHFVDLRYVRLAMGYVSGLQMKIFCGWERLAGCGRTILVGRNVIPCGGNVILACRVVF